jgi:hypothetical protein
MKIVFSRKGFDSAFGGGPSPILDGKMLSLPIPEDKKFTIRYSDVQSGWALSNVGLIVEHLLPQKAKANKYVHLDPDLRREALQTRHPDWRPLFGQVDQAQTHLANEGVGRGDLFLFYGLYRDTCIENGKIRYVRGSPKRHVIWGWMVVDEVLRIRSASDGPSWAHYHPHFTDKHGANNTVYVAATEAFDGMPGAGVFERYDDGLCLTDLTQQRVLLSHWSLPQWCAPRAGRYPLTYHANPDRWRSEGGDTLLKSTSPGQEFVLNSEFYPEAEPWVRQLIERYAGRQTESLP